MLVAVTAHHLLRVLEYPSPHDDTYHGDDPADGHPDGHWQWVVVVRTEPNNSLPIIDECPCDDSSGRL